MELEEIETFLAKEDIVNPDLAMKLFVFINAKLGAIVEMPGEEK